MSEVLESNLKDIVQANSSFGPAEIAELVAAIAEDYGQYSVLRDAVAELEMREDRTPATGVRLGVCYFLLGRYRTDEVLRLEYQYQERGEKERKRLRADGGALAAISTLNSC